MRKNRRSSKKTDKIFPIDIDELEARLQKEFKNSPDLSFSKYEHQGKKIAIFSIPYLVEASMVEDSLLSPLLNKDIPWTTQTILDEIPLNDSETITSFQEILQKLIIGAAFVYVEQAEEVVAYLLLNKEKRSLDKAETESLVLGPKIAFTESLITNLNIVRWRIRSTDLAMEEYKVGNSVPREVRIVYMKSIANETDVNTMRQRIQEVDVDEIEDSAVLQQYIEDDSLSVFPQFDSTELPDRFTYAVSQGRIGVLVENSPTGFIGPSSLFSFLESTEDLYMRWGAGSFLRFIRFIAVLFSIMITPAYVAAVTYQFGIIPTQLLISLGQSRASVPFSPIFEALLLEFLIELLREAGARLPTKVGQTMGIVGGIVIGQAAVDAGLTSNILIIFVAMSALASFASPSYLLGSTVRVIRFPLIILAGTLGLIGIIFGLSLLAIHLIRLTSLGRPYLTPLYPFQWRDMDKVFFRLPVNITNKRARSYQPKKLIRFSSKDASKKRDIDE